jgi:predicted metal-dependent phosphoesterase TrpH
VTRNLISNRARVEQGRKRILAELAQLPKDLLPASLWSAPEPTTEQADAFYRAWVEELLARCVDQLFRDLHRAGKGDHFRVLYGHVCEGLSLPQVSQMMDVPVTTAESRYKAARKRLAESLERAVREHVERYSEGHAEADFQSEWAALSAYLHTHGGLERAVREIHERAEKTGPGGPGSRPFTVPKKITAK